MRANVASALGAASDRISVKARTNDGLGREGEGRAASAHVVVLLAAQFSSGTKSALRAPHTGQYQSSGMSVNAVPGGMPPSGSPSAGS